MHRALHLDDGLADGLWHVCGAGSVQRELGGRPFAREVWPPRRHGGEIMAWPVAKHMSSQVRLCLQAKKVAPVLDRRFYDAQAWSSLAVTAHRPPAPEVVTIESA